MEAGSNEDEFAPPWIEYPDAHPYSICWRMGGGEDYIGRFWKWWEAQNWDSAQKIAYFEKWSPPPVWLAWTAEAIWDLEPDDPDTFDYAPYFVQLESRGFPTQAEYERDMNDPKWLE